jgi:2-keto-4-pentenoate hydratase/2-oxohepta-3-ene-1,7-dioic acid hydratase in catechol pathway
MTKFVRFWYQNEISYGLWKEKIKKIKGDIFSHWELSEESFDLSQIKILSPCAPSKVVLVGLNYKEHVKESQSSNVVPEEPVLFMKPSTALIGPEEKIIYPAKVERLDYEAELAVVIKDKCKKFSPDEAFSHIFGYTCLNDISARNLQKKDVQWTRAKSFDTFCPLGPTIVTDIDCHDLKIESYLNGNLKQSSNTSQMIFSPEFIVSFVSQVMTLLPGDVISTGTPQGVGPMQPGDVIEIKIEKIGTLRNYVAKEKDF